MARDACGQFIGGEAEVRAADWDGEVEGAGRGCGGAHTEEHGDGGGDGERADPTVVFAPGGERGDGEGRRLRELSEEGGVPGAFGAAGVEIDLIGGGAGDGCERAQDGLGDGCGGWEARQIRFEADNGDELCAGGEAERLVARAGGELRAREGEGGGEEGDGGGARVECTEIFGAFPSPEDRVGKL